ncbi:MAG TPA: hypothetical protein VFH78_04835, partial [Candidatus Thermoplasmatota archaeon]|nr:hypothetical protein [Candidatus Thermoplasmatota archaeon]
MSLDEPRGTDAVVRRLVEILRAPTEEAPRVEPLEPAPAPRRVVAVDGSSVVLAEAGERFLAAYRSGRVGLQNGAALPARVPPPEVVLLASAEAQRVQSALRVDAREG